MLTNNMMDQIADILKYYAKPCSLPYYYFIRQHLNDPALEINPYHEGDKIIDLNYVFGEHLTFGTKYNLPQIQMSLSKRQQISDLLSTFHNEIADQVKNGHVNHIQEVCCGKANLGLTLAQYYQLRFTGYDINPSLILELNKRLKKLEPYILDTSCGIVRDILKERFPCSSTTLTVALHACGALTDNIIKNFVQINQGSVKSKINGFLLIVPCCYDRFRDIEPFTFLSQYYQEINLDVNTELLHNLTTQIKGDEQRYKKLSDWIAEKRLLKITLNLILHQKQWRHPLFDDYTHGKYISIPDSLFNIRKSDTSLERLRNLIVKQLELCSETELDLAALEEYISVATLIKEKIVKVEQRLLPFKRLIELLIIDDRARYLQENGFQTIVRQFTDPQTTPRNIAIFASA